MNVLGQWISEEIYIRGTWRFARLANSCTLPETHELRNSVMGSGLSRQGLIKSFRSFPSYSGIGRKYNAFNSTPADEVSKELQISLSAFVFVTISALV